MVSDTTEISFTPLFVSFLAASMNHFISAACWSFDRVEGWNSASIHFLASASPAHAFWPKANVATAKATAFNRNFIVVSSDLRFDGIATPAGKMSAGCIF